MVINYFADIDRLKKFHNIEKVNNIKIVAYTVYWLVKNKPFQIKKHIGDKLLNQKPFLNNVNESFSIFIIISWIFDENVKYLTSQKEHSLWNNFIQDIEYYLVYRINTPQSLELALTGLLIQPISKEK